ncbi:hypothetical protein R3P38DRAFT_2355251, partial [Favolaschia claudopus]
CLGADFTWNYGWVLDSYPSTIHRPGSRFNPGYTLLSVDVTASVLRVRSRYCTGKRGTHHTSCTSCLGLGPDLNAVHAWAQQSAGQKPVDRLSRNQLAQKLDVVNNKLRKEGLKRVNDRKYLARSRQKVNAFRELVDIISSNEVPGLPRLLSTAKKEGWGVEKVCSKASLAVEGKYHPRNYTALDMDLAILVYEL